MDSVEIPRYIDSQMQMFFWEMDEFILAFGFFAVGIVMNSLLLAIVSIYVSGKMFRMYKDGAMPGILVHLVYWMGFIPLNLVALDAMNRRKYY